ncbi:MAG: hypothetical protein LBI99_07880 [Propionibacteriaceae bacterium]|jgi:hypothetical protein|nr:hypothetical protein [Propionibacteriaceae bacterium]
MLYFRRVVSWLVLATATNFIWCVMAYSPLGIALGILALAGLVVFHFRPLWRRFDPQLYQRDAVQAGYELVLAATAVFLIDVVFWGWLALNELADAGRVAMFIWTIVSGVVLMLGLALNGAIRLTLNSQQLGLSGGYRLLASFWIPVVNVVYANKARKEYNALQGEMMELQ